MMIELSQAMIVIAWKTLTYDYPTLNQQQHLLQGGEIRRECTRHLGEIGHTNNHLPEEKRIDTALVNKLWFVEDVYKKRQVALGKRKKLAGGCQSMGLPKAPRITAKHSYVGAAMSGAPALFMLKRQ